MDQQAREEPPPVAVLVDEKAQRGDTATSSVVEAVEGANADPPRATATSRSQQTALDEYYAARPKFDRLGNPMPQNRKPSVMSASDKMKLPGDLGPNDPRRPKSPAPVSLPGDLGPNDPRRSRTSDENPPPVHHVRHISGDSIEEGARILKDPKEPPSSPPLKESDDEGDEDGSRGRGRKRPEPGKTTAGKSVNVREDSEESDQEQIKWQGGIKPDPTKGESKTSFLAEPTIKVTTAPTKKRVHPNTAFDMAPSGAVTPVTSDDETRSELRVAQSLSLSISNIHSTPSAHRVIRQIVRGDFADIQREAEEGLRRQRMYLVATDLSPEAEYALEWTIGTVLRDGDTLLAVYATGEEGSSSSDGVGIGQGADVVKDTADIVKGLQSTNLSPNSNNTTTTTTSPSPLARSSVAPPPTSTADTRSRSRGDNIYSPAETERRRAVEAISNRCLHILRKTRLQVRVVVEVFHCKSPRHMITEVIDFLSPTLVIIGSRGQSAVKGVLLGSFSNYLVTKSSVPVMVARKKLRKHFKTVKKNRDGTLVPYASSTGRPGRFSNVIEGPRGKGLRVGGWEQVGID